MSFEIEEEYFDYFPPYNQGLLNVMSILSFLTHDFAITIAKSLIFRKKKLERKAIPIFQPSFSSLLIIFDSYSFLLTAFFNSSNNVEKIKFYRDLFKNRMCSKKFLLEHTEDEIKREVSCFMKAVMVDVSEQLIITESKTNE